MITGNYLPSFVLSQDKYLKKSKTNLKK